MDLCLDTTGFQSRRLRGVLVSGNEETQRFFQELLPGERIVWTTLTHGGRALEFLFHEPPDLLVVDGDPGDVSGVELVGLIKSENVYRQLPVVLCLKPEDLDTDLSWSVCEADDFLLHPLDAREVMARLGLTLARASRSLDANPLTRLPGNTTIIQRIQEMVDAKQEFALAYADLDHFKSFNDKYGFSRGDEALLMTARVIVNTIRGYRGQYSFVGHVGGDDFVFILPKELVEDACKAVIKSFDDIVPNFYDPEDVERGGIVSKDRQGNVCTFPIMAISIAVVVNHNAKLKHFGEASQIASALKKKAKQETGSSYVIDKRKR